MFDIRGTSNNRDNRQQRTPRDRFDIRLDEEINL